jgi:hypothetical protein
MKKIACLLSAVAVLTASVACADIVQPAGMLLFEARITDPVVVGSTGGEDLVAFDLIFENVSGDAGGNPFNIELAVSGLLHQHGAFGSIFSPTLDGPMSGDLDSHFNVFNADILAVNAPAENGMVATSDIPGGLVPTYGNMDSFSFGNSLTGLFNASGARPAGPLRTADWNVAHLVVLASDLDGMSIVVAGELGGTTLAETFEFALMVPEPATMSLLAMGGVAALIRRRK